MYFFLFEIYNIVEKIWKWKLNFIYITDNISNSNNKSTNNVYYKVGLSYVS